MKRFPVHILCARTAPFPKPEGPFNLQLNLCRCGQRLRVVGFNSQAPVVAYGVLPPGDTRP